MAILKDFTTPQGIDANYHKIVKIEVNANSETVEILVGVWANAEACTAGSSALWHEYVRVPVAQFAQNPLAAFYPVLTSHPGSYLLGGASDEAAPAFAFGIADATSEIPAPTLLEQMKAVKVQQMRAVRDGEEFGTFMWDGDTFDASAATVSRLLGAVMMAGWAKDAGQPFSVNWTMTNNAERTLDGANVVSLAQALAAHTLAAHQKYQTAKVAIAAAATLEEVQAVNWPALAGGNG